MNNLELLGNRVDKANSNPRQLRVLYSFPHKLGATRICTTAWHQADGISEAGASVTVLTGSISKPLRPQITVSTTLARGRFRLPYRLLGTLRSCILHDFIVSRQLPSFAGTIDAVHVWPLGGLRTIQVAKKLNIPTFLERPNAHTRYAYEIVKAECAKLGVSMPKGHEHDYNPAILEREEAEYALTDYLLCPSDFVAKTFLERGFSSAKILRHQYGYNDAVFFPKSNRVRISQGLTVLFAGGCAPRKGLHYALDAWLSSSAHKDGRFLIAGAFIPGYAESLSRQLAHPSITILGHRSDLPDLMRESDILVLPSIEEGSALVTSEARGCGCVLLVSTGAGAICVDRENSLVHDIGDVQTLTNHFNILSANPDLLRNLRSSSLSTANELTWHFAGRKLHKLYMDALRARSRFSSQIL